MIALEIGNIAAFMSRLLAAELFDDFELEEAVIRMSVTWTLDGHLTAAAGGAEGGGNGGGGTEGPARQDSPDGLVLWKDVRAHCYNLIRGKVMPQSFRFTLHAGKEMKARLLSDTDAGEGASCLRAMLFNILYDGEKLRAVTGVSYNTFTTDKSPDAVWDAMVRRFLEQADVSYTQL